MTEIPWLSEEPPASVTFGQLGRTPLTRLYLTFEEELTRESAAQPEGWTAGARGLLAGEGRFGRGCRLAADSALRCAIPEADRGARAWTIELWLRPEALARRDVLSLAGLLVLRCNEDGALVAEIPADPDGGERVRLRGAARLQPGEWNHVGLVVDLEDIRSLRLVVNGTVWGTAIPPLPAPRPPGELVLGDVRGEAAALEATIDELRVQLRAANTSELEEHWLARPRPLERLQLSFEDGAEELEVWSELLTDPIADSASEFARGELVHAVPGADGLSWAAGHWRRLAAVDPPVARTTHPTVYLGGHLLFTFSGETRDSHLGPMVNTQDTWLFDTLGERWTRLDTENAPEGRCHQAAAYSKDHDLVLFAGGFRNDAEEKSRYGDTWVFHVGERRWEQRHPGGVKPGLLSDCGVVYHQAARRFLVFKAGRILSYDPEQDRWDALDGATAVDEQGRPARYSSGGSVVVGYDPLREKVLLFGGAHGPGDDAEYVDDCAEYDLRENRFTVLDPPVRPSPRVRSGFAWDERHERFVLFGGVLDQDSERMDDLWVFDPRARRWTQHQASNNPSRRGGYYGMGYDPELDRFFLLCGRHSRERFLEEAWTLALDESAVASARYVFDRSGFPPAAAWFAETETPTGSEVGFRFRASADGRRFGEWAEACPAAPFVQVEVRLRPGPAGAIPRVRSMGFR